MRRPRFITQRVRYLSMSDYNELASSPSGLDIAIEACRAVGYTIHLVLESLPIGQDDFLPWAQAPGSSLLISKHTSSPRALESTSRSYYGSSTAMGPGMGSCSKAPVLATHVCH